MPLLVKSGSINTGPYTKSNQATTASKLVCSYLAKVTPKNDTIYTMKNIVRNMYKYK